MLQHPTLWTLWWVLTWGGLGCVSHQLLLTRHWITHLGVTQVSTQPSQGSLPSQKGGAHTNTASHLVCHPGTVPWLSPAQCHCWCPHCDDLGTGGAMLPSHCLGHNWVSGWQWAALTVPGSIFSLHLTPAPHWLDPCLHQCLWTWGRPGPNMSPSCRPQPVFSLRVSDTICPRLSKCPHLCSNQPPTV